MFYCLYIAKISVPAILLERVLRVLLFLRRFPVSYYSENIKNNIINKKISKSHNHAI